MSTPANQLPAGIDPIFNQEPPPRQGVPAVNALGLEVFQPYMSPNGFDTFITLLHFMIHQQEIFEGKEMKWGPEKMAIAAAPFVGFGNPSMWENAYRGALRERLLSLLLRWNRKDNKYKKENPLPWLFLEHMACDFAMTDKGYETSLAIEDILQDKAFKDKWRKGK